MTLVYRCELAEELKWIVCWERLSVTGRKQHVVIGKPLFCASSNKLPTPMLSQYGLQGVYNHWEVITTVSSVKLTVFIAICMINSST